MSTVRTAVEHFLATSPAAAGPHGVACETVRAVVEEAIGYHVSGTTVSRIMGNLGWARTTERGRVRFRPPSRPAA